ncbi:hypothetical protein MTR67_036031 [Solanum verrucosum]|uniref:peptidylprolyl isomerase n=2 Tax=Solanum verrucosum TaxID=315347 RepID=A0AAF0ZKI6_SOLVR|nr:peptidyl-prolyl cis-trans isomerase CYP95 isoform X1 [Solanum verrucosum]WMV42646.1 hypothetical protein MTR67_036031 [Solanum verrucosum]
MSKKKPQVFLDVSIDGDPVERMAFELFTDVAPKTAENFRALCTGEKGVSSKMGRPLHYKGTFFHHIVKGSVAQAGDLLRQDGNYGESIYGGKFPDESPKIKHDSQGLLSMAIADRDARGSIFSITFQADHHLDRKCVVFGKLIDGLEVLKKIESVGNEEGKPDVTVKIINCGELPDDKRKLNKLKNGKHKKSSKERRKKRRRYYTSESESSTDSDTESSESESDSDSDVSSDSEISSSSDDRRRKRKRSKRDRHRRSKRKEKRREKKRKRRDKKSKRKSKRASDSPSESESGRDGLEEDGVRRSSEGKHKSMEKKTEGNHSPSLEEGEAVSLHHKKEATDIFEGEEVEFPKENGERQSNNTKMEIRSDKPVDRQPDVVDDHPGKSRSRSISPKRTMSRSMSISPRRSLSRSRSVSPKRSVSRSPSVRSRRSVSRSPSRSGSPHRVSQRRSSSIVKSRSGSPARSISTSPVGGKRGGSVSVSPPARAHSRRRSSRSPSASPKRQLTPSPPRTSSRKSVKSKSRTPVRSDRRSPSGSPVRPSRRSPSRSPVRSSRRSASRSSGRVPSRLRPSGRSPSRSPVKSSRRSVSRSSGRVPSRRSPSRSPGRAPSRNNRRSYSRSPGSAGRRARSPVYDRARSSSRSASVDGSPKRIRRGRGFSERYSYVRRYRSRSPDRSPARPYRYGERDRYSRYRRSPRRYRSPPRGRTPPRYRGRRSRSRSVSRSPVRYRARRYSRSPVQSRSPVDRYRRSPSAERRKSPSRSRSRSESKSSRGSQSPKQVSRGKSVSSSASPPGKAGLVSYGDGSPESG